MTCTPRSPTFSRNGENNSLSEGAVGSFRDHRSVAAGCAGDQTCRAGAQVSFFHGRQDLPTNLSPGPPQVNSNGATATFEILMTVCCRCSAVLVTEQLDSGFAGSFSPIDGAAVGVTWLGKTQQVDTIGDVFVGPGVVGRRGVFGGATLCCPGPGSLLQC